MAELVKIGSVRVRKEEAERLGYDLAEAKPAHVPGLPKAPRQDVKVAEALLTSGLAEKAPEAGDADGGPETEEPGEKAPEGKEPEAPAGDADGDDGDSTTEAPTEPKPKRAPRGKTTAAK